MATISTFVTHIVSSNVNLMNNNQLKRAKEMAFYDPFSNKTSTVQPSTNEGPVIPIIPFL